MVYEWQYDYCGNNYQQLNADLFNIFFEFWSKRKYQSFVEFLNKLKETVENRGNGSLPDGVSSYEGLVNTAETHLTEMTDAEEDMNLAENHVTQEIR